MHRLVRQLGQLLVDAVTALAGAPFPGRLVTPEEAASCCRSPGEHPSCRTFEAHGQLAPGSRHVTTVLKLYDGPFPYPAVRCGACGLLATTPRALRLHRTPDGLCLDPATWRGPRGGRLMKPLPTDDDWSVWCWPW